jgi:hypothetical protein
MLGLGQKEGQDPQDKVVGVSVNPTEGAMLVYDEGLFPALFEARIAVHVEDAVGQVSETLLHEDKTRFDDREQRTKLAQVAGDEVKETKPYSVCSLSSPSVVSPSP